MSAIQVGQCGYQGTTESCQHGVRQGGRELGTEAWVVPHRKGRGGGGMSSESHPTSGVLTV